MQLKFYAACNHQVYYFNYVLKICVKNNSSNSTSSNEIEHQKNTKYIRIQFCKILSKAFYKIASLFSFKTLQEQLDLRYASTNDLVLFI